MVSAPILCHLLTPPLMSFTRALSPFVVAGARLSFSRACLNESSLIGQFSQALSLALRLVFRLLRLSFQHFIITSIFFVGTQDFGRLCTLLFIECQRLEISFRPTDSFHPFFQRYPIYIRNFFIPLLKTKWHKGSQFQIYRQQSCFFEFVYLCQSSHVKFLYT